MTSPALSTVAMTAYNLLCTICPADGNVEHDDLLVALRNNWADPSGFIVTDDLFTAAMAALHNRKLVKATDVGGAFLLWQVADPRKRIVRRRDRSGDGWDGWQVSRMETIT